MKHEVRKPDALFTHGSYLLPAAWAGISATDFFTGEKVFVCVRGGGVTVTLHPPATSWCFLRGGLLGKYWQTLVLLELLCKTTPRKATSAFGSLEPYSLSSVTVPLTPYNINGGYQ